MADIENFTNNWVYFWCLRVDEISKSSRDHLCLLNSLADIGDDVVELVFEVHLYIAF